MKLPSRGKNRKIEMLNFANELKRIDKQIGFKISARGWCYILEQNNLMTKAEFGLVENLINNGCRRNGILPIDFVAEEEGRRFSGVERPDEESPVEFMKRFLYPFFHMEEYYTPDWWEGEKYYIQMLVEKIDLKTLFKPICKKFHIPIATTKGWSSMLQRGEYARRFKKAEDKGLISVLLYCGDHDPDGLRISDFLRKNLEDIMDITWIDGRRGYDPEDLIIERFGLNNDFIIKNNLSWINNLITTFGKNLADPLHRNHFFPYVQDYLKKYGAKKCEANAIVVKPEQGRNLCNETVEKYLGKYAERRFKNRKKKITKTIDEFNDRTGFDQLIYKAIRLIKSEDIK